MKRLWVRWAMLIAFVAVLGTVFVNLGEWQLRRLDERRERNATTVANEASPIRPASEAFTGPITDAQAWERVSATGTFDADHQFVVRYRKNGEADGYEVVTPLRTSFGTVLVDRGFLPLAPGTQIPDAAPAPPSGEVTVVGHVRRSESGREGAIRPVDGQVRLINSEALQQALPYPVVDGYLGALTMTPPQTGDFQAVGVPEISEGPHFWYAVQWFMFTAIGLLGIVVFIRGDIRERRLARARRDAAAAQPVDDASRAATAEHPVSR